MRNLHPHRLRILQETVFFSHLHNFCCKRICLACLTGILSQTFQPGWLASRVFLCRLSIAKSPLRT
jgi:hypothetical protein